MTFSDNYGDESQYWHGVDATLTARLRGGFVLSGGTSTGRGVRDTCDIVAALPETLGANVRDGIEGCRVAEPWLTSVRGSAVYTVPKIDVLVSAVVRFQNTTVLSGGRPAATSGPSLTATYSIPNSVVAQSLGRLPAGGLANGTTAVNLLRSGELYPPQVRTADMRFAKILRFGGSRTDVGLDLFNVFNSNAGTAFNPSFGLDGATWNRPTSILNPRTVRFDLTVAY